MCSYIRDFRRIRMKLFRVMHRFLKMCFIPLTIIKIFFIHALPFKKKRNMENIWLWFWYIVFVILRFLAHCYYSLKYYGKGKVVPSVTNPLLLKSATKLAEEIREGKIRCQDVILAYVDRIAEVEIYINATVDRRFIAAMEEARQVDALIASGKYTKEELTATKPLLGVPFTVKVLLKVEGLRCTAGSTIFADMEANEDSPAVALMKKAGAIVIATTNSAEMGMDFETNNLVHGKTCNPYDTHRTSGGSSGGESALIGAAGSVLGLGNDLLGSIRIPSHFTGIFGHKPTVGLVPNLGCFPAPDPDIADFLYTGPMCRYAEDLAISMRVLSSKSGIPTDFSQKVDFKNLKICVMKEIRGLFTVPVRNDIQVALESAALYFKNYYNVETREVTMPSLYDASRAVISALMHGIKDLKATLMNGNGDVNEKLEYLKCFFGKSTFSTGPLRVLNCAKISLMYDEKKDHKYQEMVKWWAEEFDQLLDNNTVLMMPTMPVTAFYHSEAFHFLPNTCYTSIFNVLGLPSTHCPLGYTSDGLPYGIQIVARKNNDALTIACAIELEKAFGGWKSPSTL